MCQKCLNEGRQLWKGFWVPDFFVPLETFNKHEDIFKKDVLNLAERMAKRSVLVKNILVKIIRVEVYFFANRTCLMLLNRHESVEDAVCREIIIAENRFWNHDLWSGLYLFAHTLDGRRITRSKTLSLVSQNLMSILKQ
jgi:hypothetical protein